TRQAHARLERSGDRSRPQTGAGGRIRFLQRTRARGAGNAKKSAGLRKSALPFFAETRCALGSRAGKFSARVCPGTGGVEDPAANDERTFLAGARSKNGRRTKADAAGVADHRSGHGAGGGSARGIEIRRCKKADVV